jgi:hypothetical protein
MIKSDIGHRGRSMRQLLKNYRKNINRVEKSLTKNIEDSIKVKIKRSLLKILNGIFLVNCCNIGKAGATASLHDSGRENSFSGEGKPMKREKSDEPEQSRLKKKRDSSRNRPPPLPVPQRNGSGSGKRREKVETGNEEGEPMPPPPGIQVVCNENIFTMYDSPDCCSDELWQAMFDLKKNIWKPISGKGRLVSEI